MSCGAIFGVWEIVTDQNKLYMCYVGANLLKLIYQNKKKNTLSQMLDEVKHCIKSLTS